VSKNFYDYTIFNLQEVLLKNKFKKFNADQIFKWVYESKITDPNLMSNLSKELKLFLISNFVFPDLKLVKMQKSENLTTKFLFELIDGIVVESVLMEHEYGLSVCVSSQAGCSMGCSFCASGLLKKQRDLTVGEMVLQVIMISRLLDVTVSHVVVMGTGEPFDNYNNVMDFLRVINYKHGLQIGARHITVSTCGIVPRIYDFAKEEIRSNLAISLHAPNDELRLKLMKINQAYPLKDLIEAVKVYFEMTKRRVTFEYILLKNVNDEFYHANELSDLIRGINCYVNLIPYNPVDEFSYEKTDSNRARNFYNQLIKRGINVTLRKEMGSDIDAACGQLRIKASK